MKQPDKEEILKQAKKIMDNFHSALEKIEKEKLEEARVERDECERNETETWKTDSDFREIMFKNAKRKKDECIEAEKGKWTQ
ncbi:hypothetical protein FJZ19_02210 [Candidatus Pacearchaeota archaeon]|nr:hypothetical protein [Candidatus Pacearchaeota archaeon]